MDVKDAIKNKLKEIIKSKYDLDLDPIVEEPRDTTHGDYASNIALQISGTKQLNPMDVAMEVSGETSKYREELSLDLVYAAKPGFINFKLSSGHRSNIINKIIEKGDDFGKTDANAAKNIIVEFSSPNIAKPFTVGHLRSTVIGDSVARLHEFLGFKVFRDNHLGDWGASFGKYLAAFDEYSIVFEEIASAESPIKELVDLYIRFNSDSKEKPELKEKGRDWFKKLEEGDSKAREYWKKCIDLSFIEFNKIYEQLGISFTENDGRGYGESYFEEEMKGVLKDLEAANSEGKIDYHESEGAMLIFFDKKEKMPPLMIIKSNGTTLYATRDLATDKFRMNKSEYGYPNLTVVNEVGIEQSLYWNQIFKIEEQLGWYKTGQRVHVGHGHYRFKEGKMSTREGNVIWLEDILDRAIEKARSLTAENNPEIAKSELENISKVVGIGAIKWNDLKRDMKKDINFDWDEILNIKGNSGPYIQYTYARAKSILRSADYKKSSSSVQLNEDIEIEIANQLSKFSEVIESAAMNYAPNVVANYVYDLAQLFNNFYNSIQVIKEPDEAVKQSRLALVAATAQVIKNALYLLGIETVEKM